MKLHLPLTLLAALLAVMPWRSAAAATAPEQDAAAYAVSGSMTLEGIEYSDWACSATLSEVITMNSADTAIVGQSSITLSNGGKFDMSAGVLGRGAESRLTVDIGGGGSLFNISGGSVAAAGAQVTFGIAAGGVLDVSNANMSTGSESVTTINVAGGIFTQHNGNIGAASGSVANINVTEGGTVNQFGNVGYTIGSAVNITVTQGSYNLQSGRIGEVGAHAVILVAEGGVFNTNSASSIASRNSGNAEITVEGIFNSAGNVLASMNSTGSLTVQNSGVFNQTGGAVAYGLVANDKGPLTITVQNGGAYKLQGGSFATSSSNREVNVVIDNASFSQSGGDLGCFITNITMEVTNGGLFAMSGGSLGNSSGKFDFTVSGAGSFTLSGGARILGVVNIALSEAATFTQSGGSLQGFISLALEGEGTDFNMTGGDISGSAQVSLSDKASFTMSDEAEIRGSVVISLTGSSFTQSGGTISGNASLVFGAGASYTLEGGSYAAATLSADGAGITLAQTGGSMETALTVSGGASFTQSSGTFSGSINATGADTEVTQEVDGSITGEITLSSGASFTQSGSVTGDISITDAEYTQEGGIIARGSTITVGEDGTFRQTGGTIFADVELDSASAAFEQGGLLNGSVTVNGGASFAQSGTITGDVTVNNGSFEQNSGTIGGSVTVDGEDSSFTQDGTISGNVAVSNNGQFTNSGASILGQLTVDNASFESNGSVAGEVTVQNGGSLTQAAGALSGNVSVSGAGSSFTQIGGSVDGRVTVNGSALKQLGGTMAGGVDLVDGTVTQGEDGSMAGGVTMQGGTFDQSGSVTGEVTVSGGSYTMKDVSSISGSVAVAGASASFTQASGQITGNVGVSSGASFSQTAGSITGAVTVTDSSFRQSGSVTGNVTLTGGAYTLSGAQSSISGDVSVSGGTFSFVSGTITGNVSLTQGSDFTLTEGTLTGGSLSIAGGSSLTMNGGTVSQDAINIDSGSFNMTAGTVQSCAITAAAGSSVSLGGVVDDSVSVTLTDALLTLTAGATMAADVTMSGAASVYNLGGVAAEGHINLTGGKLKNAGSFAGTLSIDTASDYAAAIDLGGVNAGAITSIHTRSAEAILTGLGVGTLTITGDQNSMVVGANTSTGLTEGSDCLISFADKGGTVAFADGAKLTLNFSTDLILEAASKELEGPLTIHVTNGTLSLSGNEVKDYFTFGSGFAEVVKDVSYTGGDLVLRIDTDLIWIASEDGTEVTHPTEIAEDTAVVVDVDMTIRLAGSYSELTLNHLMADGAKTGNLSVIADHQQTIELNNDSSAPGAPDGNTVFNGNITVSGAAEANTTLKKTGEGTLTLGGVLTTGGTLAVEQGKVVLMSTGNTVGTLNMENAGAELSIAGDLTLTGDSALQGGSITGGGLLTLQGGKSDLTGAALAINLTATDGATVTNAGPITGDVTLQNGSSFNGSGQIDGSVSLIGSGSSALTTTEGGISGGVSISAAGSAVELRGEIGQGVEISGAQSRVSGATSVGGDVVLSGEGASFSGSSSEATAISGRVLLSGEGADVSSVGTLKQGATLSGASSSLQANGNIDGAVEVSGTGATLTTAGTISGDVMLSAAQGKITAANITGAVDITGAGSVLTLTGSTVSGNITLNADTATLDFSNAAVAHGEGVLTIIEGKLANAGSYTGDVYINTSMSGMLDLGGLNAANVKSIKTADAVSLINLAGTLTFSGSDSLLTVGTQHIGLGAETAEQALIQFAGGSGTITFGEAAVKLQFTDELLKAFGSGDLSLLFTNGTISDFSALGTADEVVAWLTTHLLLSTGSGLEFIYFTGEEGNNTIRITAATRHIWQTSEESSNRLTTVDGFDEYGQVIIDRPTALDVVATAQNNRSVIKQLQGNSTLSVSNSGSEPLTVELRNESFFNNAGEQVSWGETTFSGDILATGAVDVEKAGNDSLILNGNLSTPGALSVTEGTLALNGSNNTVASLAEVDGSLVVNGVLTLTGAGTLSGDGGGSVSGSGVIVVNDSLTVKEGVQLNGPAMVVNGVLDLASAENVSIGGLSGSGEIIVGSHGLDITGGQGVFSGELNVNGLLNIIGSAQQTLAGSGNAGCRLNVGSKAALILESDSAAYDSVTNSGTLCITPNGSGAEGAAVGRVAVQQEVHLLAGSVTEFVVNFDSTQDPNTAAPLLSSKSAVLESGQSIVVTGVGLGVTMPTELKLVLIDTTDGVFSGEETTFTLTKTALADGTVLTNVETKGLFNVYYENAQAIIDGNGKQVVFTAGHRTSNIFAPAESSYNSTAGSTLLWAAKDSLDLSASPTLGQVISAVADLAYSGKLAEAGRALAAVAGSTVTSLSAAQSDSLRQQLDRTRRHTRYMLPATGAAKLKSHAWVEAIGNFAKLSTEGDESGYNLNSWGGSVGADVELNPNLTVGLSLTALYGDLDATAAEPASGKLDAYYLSLFLRGNSGKWTHSFAMVGGVTNASLNRSVDLGSFAYSTSGSTDGTSLGLLYELAYSFTLNEAGRSILQPIAGIMVNSVNVKGYDEAGADGAGLRVSDQSRTVTTLSLGARWLTELDAATFGKTASVELSAAIAQDLGDTRSVADVALLGNPGVATGVRGAETGSTSFRLGAGISLPVSDNSQIFFSGNTDLRSGSTLWNANLGFRISF